MDIVYTVVKGDNLYSIAKKFNTTVSNIMFLNDLHNTLLSVGQTLIIKKNQQDEEIQIGSDICGTYHMIDDPSYDTYIVKPKDNLYTIAKKFNTTIEKIIYINNLKNQLLSVNQVLKVPHIKENYLTYQVKKGDSIYSIAENYNITAQKIIDFNQLPTHILIEGQVIKIPIY